MIFQFKVRDKAGTYWTNFFPQGASVSQIRQSYERMGYEVLDMFEMEMKNDLWD